MKTKNLDFIELEFEGRIKGTSELFDTNVKSIAEKEGGDTEKLSPKAVQIGKNSFPKGFNDALVDKETGKDFEVSLPAKEAFGDRRRELVRLLPASKFADSEFKPMVGLQVEINGMPGIIKSVTGGRVLIDFNHPLAGRDVVYKFKILRILEQPKEKLEVAVQGLIGKNPEKVEISEQKISVSLKAKELPENIIKELEKEMKERVPELKEKPIAFEFKA
jgi:FKBP-type peptidyl-prolyl cis-trans isomerase SlyD